MMNKCPHCKKEINQDYEEIIYKNKTFGIYKWEDKKFKDFPIPKGFNWCEYFDFIELVNEEKIELEKYPIEYYTKNQFKNNIKKDWELYSVYFNRNGNVNSNNDNLQNSNDNGRVVVCKIEVEDE